MRPLVLPAVAQALKRDKEDVDARYDRALLYAELEVDKKVGGDTCLPGRGEFSRGQGSRDEWQNGVGVKRGRLHCAPAFSFTSALTLSSLALPPLPPWTCRPLRGSSRCRLCGRGTQRSPRHWRASTTGPASQREWAQQCQLPPPVLPLLALPRTGISTPMALPQGGMPTRLRPDSIAAARLLAAAAPRSKAIEVIEAHMERFPASTDLTHINILAELYGEASDWGGCCCASVAEVYGEASPQGGSRASSCCCALPCSRASCPSPL